MDERSLSRLVGDSIADLSRLLRTEVSLAMAEASEKLVIVAGSAKLIAAGVAILIPALVLILLAVAAGLVQLGVPPALGYLCTGLAGALVAYLFLRTGFVALSSDSLRPRVILSELQRDKVTAKEFWR